MAGTVRSDAYNHMLALLVELRGNAGISQAELAKQLGKPPSFVGKFELGERRLDVIELLVILRVLDVSESSFLTRLDNGLLPTKL